MLRYAWLWPLGTTRSRVASARADRRSHLLGGDGLADFAGGRPLVLGHVVAVGVLDRGVAPIADAIERVVVEAEPSPTSPLAVRALPQAGQGRSRGPRSATTTGRTPALGPAPARSPRPTSPPPGVSDDLVGPLGEAPPVADVRPVPAESGEPAGRARRGSGPPRDRVGLLAGVGVSPADSADLRAGGGCVGAEPVGPPIGVGRGFPIRSGGIDGLPSLRGRPIRLPSSGRAHGSGCGGADQACSAPSRGSAQGGGWRRRRRPVWGPGYRRARGVRIVGRAAGCAAGENVVLPAEQRVEPVLPPMVRGKPGSLSIA